jgi:hypothetical protein
MSGIRLTCKYSYWQMFTFFVLCSLFFVLFLSVHGHYTIVLQESFNSRFTNRESHTFPSLDGFIIDSSSIFIDFVTYAMPVALQIPKATRNCADVEHYSLPWSQRLGRFLLLWLVISRSCYK